MNFFEHQDRARRQTRRMLFLFALAVLAIVAVTDAVLLFALNLDAAHRAGVWTSWCAIWPLSSGMAMAILLGSAYRIATLSGGGASVARELGGTETSSSDNFANRRLRNVVEEMAIASGVPVPRIFVLENE